MNSTYFCINNYPLGFLPVRRACPNGTAIFRQGQSYFAARDYDNAITYLKKANDLYGGDSPLCQFNIAECYRRKQNDSLAVYWCRKAAEQGDNYAQLVLSHCYKNGYGVEQSDLLAEYWYKKCVESEFEY